VSVLEPVSRACNIGSNAFFQVDLSLKVDHAPQTVPDKFLA
jgi:hypothetical protein